jgi:hypothetical protein
MPRLCVVHEKFNRFYDKRILVTLDGRIGPKGMGFADVLVTAKSWILEAVVMQ